MLEPLIDINTTARRLISGYGRDAANQAFMEALDESVIGDKAREAFWIEVAVVIMKTQRRVPQTAPTEGESPGGDPQALSMSQDR